MRDRSRRPPLRTAAPEHAIAPGRTPTSDDQARLVPIGVESGIDAAVVELYEREDNGIARLAYFLVGDRERAEDLAHATFVRLHEHARPIIGG